MRTSTASSGVLSYPANSAYMNPGQSLQPRDESNATHRIRQQSPRTHHSPNSTPSPRLHRLRLRKYIPIRNHRNPSLPTAHCERDRIEVNGVARAGL